MERQNYAQEAMNMTPEQLETWAIGDSDNSFRREIAKLAPQSARVAVAQIETARSTRRSAWYMLASVIVLAVTGAVSAAFQYLKSWMIPHVPK